MSRKIYTIEHLGCANCAAKMEAKMNALPQVQEATITFAIRQLRITADDPDGLLPQLQKIVSSIEPDAVICDKQKDSQAHYEECGCCHCHQSHHAHHHHEHNAQVHHGHYHSHTEQGESLWPLVLGTGLFGLGLVMELAGLLGLPAYILAYMVLGGQVLITAVRNLIRGHILDENFLMSIATLGAFVIREYPEAVGIMLFYRVGAYFEEKAVARSRSQIMEAVDLRPETVNRIHGDHTDIIPAEQAQIGDLLLVRPGSRIPLDGVVVSGESRIDTAPITGEPVPVSVAAGDSVISGCMNTSGQITIRVEKSLTESMVTRILNAVEKAAAGKPKIDRFITRFSRIYTPGVVALAGITAVVPSVITGNWSYWVYTALSFLVMSCPCALVVSVPLAFFSGIGLGGKKGILFKGGVSMEALAGIRVVAMDKTGTVTKGDFRVQKTEGPKELLEICAACEQNSTHPIAVSITEAAREQGIPLSVPEVLEEVPGHGIRAVLDGRNILCGNEKLLTRFGVPVPEVQGPGSMVFVAVDGRYIGHILVADTLKSGAKEAVTQLQAMDIDSAMLTGDGEENAQAVARQTGIRKVYARLLPEEKLQVLQQLRSEQGAVMFVGDGINDTPVLAGADVGAAMGSGADAAIEAADVVYMTSDVQAIPESISIARRTRQIAWQNVVFALAIKAAVMILGLLGGASMWMAVFADSGVAMLCILNSVRLLYKQ